MADTARILEIPREAPVDDPLLPWRLGLVRSGAKAAIWPVQRKALGVLERTGGLILQAGCGDGKTLVGLLGAAVCDAKRPLYLCPPSLVGQVRDEANRMHNFGFCVPSVEIRSHVWVSTQPTGLERMAPDYVFVDEAHAFRRPESARHKRLIRYLVANPPRTWGGKLTLAFASGTLGESSILELTTLFRLALGRGSPLPVGGAELDAWANVLDPDGQPGPQDWAIFAPIVRSARMNMEGTTREKRQIARKAFDLRRRSTPGVVVSDSDSVPCSLVIYPRDEPKAKAALAAAIAYVEADVLPDGSGRIEDPTEKSRHAKTLAAGFWYRWHWPNVGRQDPDLDWIDARAAWQRGLRRELEYHATIGYDSEKLVKIAARTKGHKLGKKLAAWEALADRYDIDTLREAVWISDEILLYAINLANQLGAIVWYESLAAEARLKQLGFPTYGKGSKLPSAGVPCALARKVWFQGHNLQDRWNVAIYLEVPSSGVAWEQSLARIHRAGQKADECVAIPMCHAPGSKRAFQKARERARFLESIQGRQRLCYCPIVSIKGV